MNDVPASDPQRAAPGVAPTAEVTAFRVLAPLYSAGFVTAFGAHAVAASLGTQFGTAQVSLFALGVALAVYDIAEVLLKPVFGSLADRWGPRPVLLGGLAVFALVSGAFTVVDLVSPASGSIVALALVRLGQGAAASAFSPAAGAMVGRLVGPTRRGRVFGSYGAWKGLGYTAGPLLGGVIITFGGLAALFATLGAVAAAVAIWIAVTVPVVDPLPRRRQTLADLGRRLLEPGFLRPTSALAATTAALSVGVGFFPVIGVRSGLSPVATGAVVACLALASTLVQPRAGRAHDRGRLSSRQAMAAGFALTVAGFVIAATVPGLGGLILAAVAVGLGVGTITPVAFADLAAGSRPERLGQTMGSAEVGRELGDGGGPLLVGALASVATVAGGLGGFAVVLAAIGVAATGRGGRRRIRS
ncbi:MFS transporter [Pseudonocardia sp. CA-142604]|uniref:MFS transporter n=1 Tax=Pseudonocardia sp. CA-142604 TaxID=3240024 RepID=UPI003D8BCBA3